MYMWKTALEWRKHCNIEWILLVVLFVTTLNIMGRSSIKILNLSGLMILCIFLSL